MDAERTGWEKETSQRQKAANHLTNNILHFKQMYNIQRVYQLLEILIIFIDFNKMNGGQIEQIKYNIL